MGGCELPTCIDPEEIGCHLGHGLGNCPHFAGRDSAESTQPAPLGDGARFPWTGAALGEQSLAFVAAHSPARLLGIVGLSDAGKTTFLMALYLEMTRGRGLPDRRFAGSYTLQGWESLASNFRMGSWDRPRFPSHTSASGGRQPGLLHLAAASAAGGIEDVLFTDAPGEWYQQWATDVAHPGAEGARWIGRHADGFLFFVDREALAGDDRTMALNRHRELAARLADEVRDRPVAIVWTKTDVDVPPVMHRRMDSHLQGLFPGAPVYGVSTQTPDGVAGMREAVGELLDRVAPRGLPLPNVTAPDADPFYRLGHL